MSSNDFFNNLDKEIKTTQTKKVANAEKKSNLENFLRQAIKDITPTLQEYEAKLKERNINCKLNISDLSFSLIMNFKDGGHHGIIFGRERHSQYESFTFQSTFTNDDGKNFIGTDAQSINERNWSKDLVVNKLEKEIKDFIFYSERHGGY